MAQAEPAVTLITGERLCKHSQPKMLCSSLALRVEEKRGVRLTGQTLEDRIFVSRLMTALRCHDEVEVGTVLGFQTRSDLG